MCKYYAPISCFQAFLSFQDVVQTDFQTNRDISLAVWPPAGLLTILTPGSTFLNPVSVNLVTAPPGGCRLM